MQQKKICMLGAFAVGKTSLVARYVRSIFSEDYHTTIGVKIDKKVVQLDGGEQVKLVLWDIHGEDEFQTERTSYLRGAAGCLLVVDGTRAPTLDTALGLRDRAREQAGDVPCVFAVNKSDLSDQWELDEARIAEIEAAGLPVLKTSAKSGVGVEEAFGILGRMVVKA